jgi:uncharacterized membrane protein
LPGFFYFPAFKPCPFLYFCYIIFNNNQLKGGAVMEKKDLGKTSVGMQPNVAAVLSYLLGFVTGIIFFLVEKENKFVRFHAMQSIVVFGFLFVLNIVLPFIPVIGWVLMPILSIAAFILWIVLMISAGQGKKTKMPFAGDIAEKNA